MPRRGLRGEGAGRAAAGLGLIVLSQVATLGGYEPFATWNTPISWWGYIFFLDGLVEYLTDRSWMRGRPREFWGTCVPVSIATWTAFDLMNRLVRNWLYVFPEGLSGGERLAGYAASFATVTPAVLLTAAALEALGLFRGVRVRPWRVGPATEATWLALGVVFLAVPLVVRRPEACPALWLFAVFLLEPVNRRIGAASLLRDLENGYAGRILRLAAAGLVCGFLWEWWNYWARAKWVYTIPYLPEVRLFEMPVVGYLGFIPFAWEVFAVYATAARLAHPDRAWLRAEVPASRNHA